MLQHKHFNNAVLSETIEPLLKSWEKPEKFKPEILLPLNLRGVFPEERISCYRANESVYLDFITLYYLVLWVYRDNLDEEHFLNFDIVK